ncbi:MAG: hypothetical protein M1296_04390 [Chloroflexi bacterium]|nr:hypothetical protein [Chloroflexota bacterium]
MLDSTLGVIGDLLHAILIGGIISVRYLWPVWILIAALWLLTRGLRSVLRWLGFPVKSTPRPHFPSITVRSSRPRPTPRKGTLR